MLAAPHYQTDDGVVDAGPDREQEEDDGADHMDVVLVDAGVYGRGSRHQTDRADRPEQQEQLG